MKRPAFYSVYTEKSGEKGPKRRGGPQTRRFNWEERDMLLEQGERLEPLGKELSVIVCKEHGFGTDAILLAHFSRPGPKERAVELGTGCGVISLLWCREYRPAAITAVELQQRACQMARRSVEGNGLSHCIQVVQEDLRNLKGTVPFGAFDVAACNPPYQPLNSGPTNPDPARCTARHEAACTIGEVTRAAAGLLRFSGRLCLCQRPERLCDVLEAMRQSGIEPKRLRLVQQRPEKAPKLFLVEGKKGARPGGLVVLPTLFIEDGQGGYSREMREIYGDYRKEGTK